MKRFKYLSYLLLFLSAFAIVLTGCGGGGGTTTTTTTTTEGTGTGTALTISEKVSVVDAQSSGGKVAALKLGNLYLSPDDMSATSQYKTDPQNVYVNEQSAEAFDITNEILCWMAQSQYDDMVNKGNYKAQIDLNQCKSTNDSASAAGQSSSNQSSGSTAPDYEMWTVNSSRADNTSPHIIKVWMHEEASGDEPAKTIYVKVTITEGKSSTNPYGIFTMNFDAYPEAGGDRMFRGYLKTEKDATTSEVLLKFVVSGDFGNSTFREKITLNRAINGERGSGTTYMSDTWGGESKTGQFDIAFDTSNFRRKDVSTSQDMCFSRTTFDETVWRYGLYSSNGNRVERNSGFNIKKGDAYGWIGYYGIWFPQSVTINDGDEVSKVTFGQGGETLVSYTVLKKGGKLKKHTKKETTLGNIKGIPLDGWEQTGNYRAKWTGTQFVKFATQNQTTYMWEDITEVALDLSNLNFGELNFWSQSLGGQVRVKLINCIFDQGTGKFTCDAPTNATPVAYFVEEVVFPGDTVPSTLRCYDNCPEYNATSGVTSSGWGGDPNNPTAYNYTFSALVSGMVLKDSQDRSMLLTQASGQNQWGFMSGPLFQPTTANLASLACDFNPDQTCGWKAWSALSEFYTWETGPNQWNQFTALVSGGTPLRFEAPLQVQYTYPLTGSIAKYQGSKFFLEYSGFGNLWGIPGKCVTKDGEDVNCGPDTRWIAEFSIADGSEVLNSADTSIAYLVKALDKEQRMSNVAAGNCSALTLTSYTLPDIALWVDPDIGTEPTVTNAPAVIGGVLQ